MLINKYILLIKNYQVQRKPLNVITLGPRETDHITQMITISKSIPYLSSLKSVYRPLTNQSHKPIDNIISDHIKRLPLYKQQISNLKFQISSFKFQVTNFKLQISKYRIRKVVITRLSRLNKSSVNKILHNLRLKKVCQSPKITKD